MIDLRSDTVTKPDQAMRHAAQNATVSDDVYDGDPTAAKLESRAADLVGMEAALFVPSGTMGNQIAIRGHTNRGDEIMLEAKSHIYRVETGAAAQLSGVQSYPIDGGERAVPNSDQLHDVLLEGGYHQSKTGLLTIENTHNFHGGVAIPKSDITPLVDTAHEFGVPVHVDGARIFNAAVALDTTPKDLLENVDSVMFCLSKGLGAPIGSILAGTQSFISEARETRKLFGGAMRQVGIVAAPGLLALENVHRLKDDHEKAQRLAAGLDRIADLSITKPDTNILLVNSRTIGYSSAQLVEQCAEIGVRGSSIGEFTTRFCTHLDVSDEEIETAIDRIGSVLKS